jgi:hypothetical protein
LESEIHLARETFGLAVGLGGASALQAVFEGYAKGTGSVT